MPGPTALDLMQRLYRDEGESTGGMLHVQLDDGNLEDEYWREPFSGSLVEIAGRQPLSVEVELVEVFRAMTEDERHETWHLFHDGTRECDCPEPEELTESEALALERREDWRRAADWVWRELGWSPVAVDPAVAARASALATSLASWSRTERQQSRPPTSPIDHRELLRKYIRHTFASEPTGHVSTESAARFIADWLASSSDFTAEEKAEMERLAADPPAGDRK